MTTSADAGQRVGVVGVGTMGWRIVQALSREFSVTDVCDVATPAQRRARAGGFAVHEEVTAMLDGHSTIVLSLPDPTQVKAVVGQIADSGSAVTVLDTSTIDPATARWCRERMLRVGGEYADCPVLGRPEGVGTWTQPVGGSTEAFLRAATVLAPLARTVTHVGEVGAASSIKVLNNLMFGAINAITAEVLVLAAAADLDPGVFVDVILGSGAASVSGLFKDIGPRAVAGDFDPTFSVRLLHKDNALALAMARDHDVPLIVGAAVQAVNTMAVASGRGERDSIAVIEVLEAITGRQARRGARAAAVPADGEG